MMNQDEFIEAVKAAIKEVLAEIYRDSETRERLFVQLIQKYQQWLDDCRSETQTAEAQLKSLMHREVDTQATSDQWRERYERGEKRIEQLEEMVNKLNIRIEQLERSRA